LSRTEHTARSSEETIALGRDIAARLGPPVIVALRGELGSGKTTLAKGIISGLGAAREEDVTSPTFTLVHVYRNPLNGLRVHHADLYRVSDFHDLETLGLEDVFDQPGVLIVEWAEKLTLRSDWPVLDVELAYAGDAARRIAVQHLPAFASRP